MAVDNAELSQCALVATMRIVEHTMFQCNSRSVGSLVDDADSLTVWDILATVSLGLNDGKVIELKDFYAFCEYVENRW